MGKSFLTILLIFFFIPLSGHQAEYGIHLQTWPHPATEFTSISLEDGKAIHIDKSPTRLSFRIWNREESLFGSVFRIVTDRGKTIDLMYGVADNDKRFPNLIIDNTVYQLSQPVSTNQWIDVALCIEPQSSTISITYDNETLAASCPEVMPVHEIRLYFGSCFLSGFELENVASVNIKDICISQGGRKIREWDFMHHHGDTTYDKIGSSPATVRNGKWLIDSHTMFRKIFDRNFHSEVSIAFNPDEARFYLADSEGGITVFDCASGREIKSDSKGGNYCATYPNSIIYIQEQEKLLSMNLDQCTFSTFDFATGEWVGEKRPEKNHKEYYWNNSVTWNPEDSTIISFGGYGHYQFNNELLISYPFNPSRPQKRIFLKEIDPRYNPSTVLADSLLYIFGGRGNASGKQEMTQKYYYDLYAVNLNTLQVFRIWEMQRTADYKDFKPSSNMIYDKASDCFYIYNDQYGGMLIRLARTEPKIETMSYPTFIPLNAQYLYTNLYFCPKTEKLYALYRQTSPSMDIQVYIHELDWPPIPLKDAYPDSEAVPAEKKSMGGIVAACAAAVLAAIAIACILVFRKRRTITGEVPQQEKPSVLAETPPDKGKENGHIYDLTKKSICFLGGFRAFDRDGNEITELFTPTLKSLLVLLILYTAKDEKGISGNKLIQTLWFDKTEESAKNNRNVYMSKLRNILDRIGQIKIVCPKGFWSISIEDDSVCDYLEASRLFSQNGLGSEEQERLVDLLLRGVMLPNMEEDWLDPFKNDFSNMTIDFLIGLLKQSGIPDDFMLRIADTLFQHDFISEEALRVKCRILYRQGKKGLAKTVYDTFCKDYYTSLGTEFRQSLKDLVI